MVQITEKEILHLANLSRIKIETQEVAKLAHELEAVLVYASSLSEIAQRAPQSMAQGGGQTCAQNVMREDQIVRYDSANILDQAPQREEDFFVVPQIIKRG